MGCSTNDAGIADDSLDPIASDIDAQAEARVRAAIAMLDETLQRWDRVRAEEEDTQAVPSTITAPCDECSTPVSGEDRLWDGVSDMWLCESCYDPECHGGPLATWWTPEIEQERHNSPLLWKSQGGE